MISKEEAKEKIRKIKGQMYKIDNKNSTKYIKLEDEFNKLDKEIDMIIYDIYGLNSEEKELIEESLK